VKVVGNELDAIVKSFRDAAKRSMPRTGDANFSTVYDLILEWYSEVKLPLLPDKTPITLNASDSTKHNHGAKHS
jgi:hypothetical protein